MLPSSPGRPSAGLLTVLVAAAITLSPGLAFAQRATTTLSAGYRPHARLAAALDSLRRANPQLVSVREIAKSPGGRAVHVVRVGTGGDAADKRPAVLVVANAHGPHVVSSEVAVRMIASMVSGYGRDTAVKNLLDRQTFYIVPRANPDAAEAFFSAPLHERVGNDHPTDSDRDGKIAEDGPEDLNGDGLITMMRVEDPAGPWIADSANPLLMRRADATRGQRGRYRLLTEGRDNDKDGEFNEDGPGGTDINANFPNFYEYFGAAAGDWPLAAPEAWGIAELFQTHQNIAAAYVLGPQDNLNTPWTGRRVPGIGGNPQGTSAGGPFSATLPEDDPWFAEASRVFKRSTGWQRGPAGTEGKGDVLSWIYYHMGRLAFGSRTWWTPDVPADTTRRAGAPAGGGAGGAAPATGAAADPLAAERQALRWLEANRPEMLVAWTRVEHPDFPGKVVEVGGIAPYATLNPPAAELDSLGAKHTRFVQEIAAMLPRLELRVASVESLGPRTWRITAQIANAGYFPTLSAMGVRARWAQRVRVDLKTARGQEIASGRSMQLLNPLRGSGTSTELTWVVVGDAGSSVTLSAASPVTGEAAETITLRAR